MVQKVIKYGRSQAVVLPKDVAVALGLQIGSLVEIRVEDGRGVIWPVEVVPKLSAQDRQFVRDVYRKRQRVFKKLAE